jgi:hypothetical protein
VAATMTHCPHGAANRAAPPSGRGCAHRFCPLDGSRVLTAPLLTTKPEHGIASSTASQSPVAWASAAEGKCRAAIWTVSRAHWP